MPLARIVLWVSSLGGIALLVRSLWIGPVPLSVAIAAFALYAALCTVGILVPQFEMFGDVVWRAEPGAKAVALTFDDGPFPATTRQILKILEQRQLNATFFVIGRKAAQYPKLLAKMHQAGHELALHGFQHDRLYSLKPPNYVAQDIARTREAIERACGVRPDWFRPPVGYVSSRTAAGARRAGVALVAWSARGVDGMRAKDPEKVAERILRQVKDGGIILLHDAAERDDFVPASIEALPLVLDGLAERGLSVVTLSELVGSAQDALRAGDDPRDSQPNETADDAPESSQRS